MESLFTFQNLIIFIIAWVIWDILGKLSTKYIDKKKLTTGKSNTEAEIEMPKYILNKVVYALKIKSVIFDQKQDFGILVFEDERYENISLPKDYFFNFHPVIGGYYITFKGNVAYVNSQEFEEDSSLIGPHDTVASFNFKSFVHELQKTKTISDAWYENIITHVVSSGGSEEVATNTATTFMKNTFNFDKAT